MIRHLVLVPTNFELQKLRAKLPQRIESDRFVLEVCGFGPLSSGIRTVQLLAQYAPCKVILIGIAGALTTHSQIGTASEFSQIGCYGIGAGSGSNYQTSDELGWDQWNDPGSDLCVGDVIQLPFDGSGQSGTVEKSMLLTVCSAAADTSDVAQRLAKFPDAIAEDMEAYAVAMACLMAQTELTVVRGLSNVAGDRNKSHWKVDAALAAAAEVMMSRINQ